MIWGFAMRRDDRAAVKPTAATSAFNPLER
jgi:hypothetical protein